MPITLNNVIRLRFHWRDTRTQSEYVNIRHFRVIDGGVSGVVGNAALTALAGQIDTVLFDRWAPVMADAVSCIKIVMTKVLPTLDIDYELPLDQMDNNAGTIAPAQTLMSPPQMSWHFTGRSFVPGRKGIGHFYLPGATTNLTALGGWFVGGVSEAAMTAVADSLGDPLNANEFTLKPIIVGFPRRAPGQEGPLPVPVVTDANDVRKWTLTPRPTFHKLRRAGMGM